MTAAMQAFKAFFFEVLAAMREGPGIFFAPVRAAIEVARAGFAQDPGRPKSNGG